MKKITLFLCLLLITFVYIGAQDIKSNVNKPLIFSTVKGQLSKPDTIHLPTGTVSVKWLSGDTAYFSILSSKKGKCVIAFQPPADLKGISRATLGMRNTSGTVTRMDVTGLSTKALEGENEIPLSMVANALGYHINIGWEGLPNTTLPILQGDEIAASLFNKAGKGNVDIIPVARYSPDFELPFGYYTDSAGMPRTTQVGVLAKAGMYPEHQSLFPAIAQGGHAFDPGNKTFGFYAVGPTHTAYSEDVWNMLFHPGNVVHPTRIYPLKDASGNSIKNSYLLCFEEAKNGDYNDYVFVVKNIKPVTTDPFTRLFNGVNMDGWHSFLKDIGINTDPDNNFKIEDSVLHVLGKDLGYVITEKGYSDYHFKVDFKWGDRRWGSRQKEKRDAGVCYNIPMDEPDSIWPRSIECQVQEGDVGDFWLLGFSTIKVKGEVNRPSNHTRMIKYADGEKPTGEWNTLEIISYHGRCIHIVNGIIVNVGDEASVKDGKILLQSEFAEVYYKNVKIRKL